MSTIELHHAVRVGQAAVPDAGVSGSRIDEIHPAMTASRTSSPFVIL